MDLRRAGSALGSLLWLTACGDAFVAEGDAVGVSGVGGSGSSTGAGGVTGAGGSGGVTGAGGAGGVTSAGGAGGVTSAGGAGGVTSAGGAGGVTSAGGAGGAGGGAGSEPADCVTPPGSCKVGACVGGACSYSTAKDGTACDDGDACTKGDACAAGACAGAPLDCSGLDGACVIGVCGAGKCTAAARSDDTLCEDGNLCTLGDHCVAGVCTKGIGAVGCSSQGPCKQSACNPATGQCQETPKPDGSACTDGNACTVDKCFQGACQSVSAVCGSSDGCCPAGCDGNDPDCTCTDVALTAKVSLTGPGPVAYVNDGQAQLSCLYATLTNSPSVGADVELTWPAAVTVAAIHVDGAAQFGLMCGVAQDRHIASMVVQYWNEQKQAYLDAGVVGSALGDITMTFGAPVTTSRLRLHDIRSGVGENSVVYEVFAFPIAGCTP
jgi:hypothetical protein